MELKLPVSVVDRHDLAQMSRELRALDDYMLQQQLRKPGETNIQLPRISRVLEEATVLNGLNLLSEADRKKLKSFFDQLKEHAPIMHVSFAVDPPTTVISRLLEWFRREIHPYTLIKFGLQPTVAAGCVLRTYSKYYDLSLKKSLQRQNHKLIELIREKDAQATAHEAAATQMARPQQTQPTATPAAAPAPPAQTQQTPFGVMAQPPPQPGAQTAGVLSASDPAVQQPQPVAAAAQQVPPAGDRAT